MIMKKWIIKWENTLQFGKNGMRGPYNSYAEAYADLKTLMAQNDDKIIPSDTDNPYVFTTVCGYWIIEPILSAG